MGTTAQLIGRVTAGTLTLGGTEALGVGKKAGKITSDVFLPGVDKFVGSPLNKPSILTPVIDAIAKPGMTDAEREQQARLAADKRRKDYQNMGRSSTILTGPGGLGGVGAGEAKTLLGY